MNAQLKLYSVDPEYLEEMQVRIAMNEILCIPLIRKEATEKVMNFERYVDEVS